MTQRPIILSAEAHIVMAEDALRSFPDECCGFFYGEDGSERHVVRAVPVINSKEGDKRRRFEISPQQYIKAERDALEFGLVLLGIYHSHPLHPAIASEHDRVVALPYFSYIILATNEHEVADIKSWLLNDQRQFEEEPVLLPNEVKHTNN